MKRCLLWLVVFIACFSPMMAEAQTVVIGIVDGSGGKAHYEPLLNHLNGAGSYRFEIAFFDTVDDLFRAFTAGEVRLAMFGSVFYAKIHREIGAVPVVKDRPNLSVIFVKEGSSIQKVEDLRGKRLLFGYEESTTSNLIPRMALWQHKIKKTDLTEDPKVFKNDSNKVFVAYAGNQRAVIEGVLSGKHDAGAVVDAVFENNKERGLRAIYSSERYPGVPLVCRRGESRAFTADMQRLFISYSATQSGRRHHFDHGASRASDSDYNPVRYLCNVVLGDNYSLK